MHSDSIVLSVGSVLPAEFQSVRTWQNQAPQPMGRWINARSRFIDSVVSPSGACDPRILLSDDRRLSLSASEATQDSVFDHPSGMDGRGLGNCVAVGFAGFQTSGFHGAFMRRAPNAEDFPLRTDATRQYSGLCEDIPPMFVDDRGPVTVKHHDL